jgi:hypothetical protein
MEIGGNLVDGVSRHGPYLLKGTVDINAKDLKVLAYMGMSPLAGRAIAASRKRADNHRIAKFEALDIFTYGDNLAGHFMADYPVGSDPGIHGTVKYMEITAANPTIGYT